MQKVKKAVILAAGFGTRFLPYTKAVSKVMLPIIDTPTIQLIVEEAVESGIEEILIIVGFNKESIISHFSSNKYLEERLTTKPDFLNVVKHTSSFNIKFIEQKIINGTGGAVLLAEEFVNNEPFLLMYADDLMLCKKKTVSKQILEAFEKTGKNVIAVQSVPKNLVTKYSSIEYSKKTGRLMEVSKIIEKPKFEEIKSTYSSLGRFVLTPDVFKHAKNLQPSVGGEIYITDSFDMLAQENKVVSYDFEGNRYDIGNKLGYLKAVADFALQSEDYGKDFGAYLKNKLTY